ncbi:hypothetical protein ABTD73_20515, partial [Acinetobacter baumannii]
KLPVRGQPVAIAPHAKQLVMTGSADLIGLKALLEITHELVASPRGMAALPMVFGATGWAPFALPPNHELFEDFDRLRLDALSQ